MYQNPKTQIEIVMFPMARSLTKEKFNEIINNKDYDFATCFIRRKLMILLCLKYN